jgi:hypothetical protein
MRWIGVLIILSSFIYPCIAQTVDDHVYLSAIGAYKSTFDRVSYNTSADIKMGNIAYPEGIQFHSAIFSSSRQQNDAYFNLDRIYNRLTGLIGLDDDNQWEKVTLTFKGDDIELQKITMLNADLPVSVDLDVSGVRRLTLDVVNEEGYGYLDVDLTNMVLRMLPQA